MKISNIHRSHHVSAPKAEIFSHKFCKMWQNAEKIFTKVAAENEDELNSNRSV
jgi:hypothetical protein